ALELLRVADRSGRACFGAEPAIHALADVDVEMTEAALLRLLVHVDADRDAADRADALAREAAGADVEIDFENASVAARQRLLDRFRDTIRILDRHRPAHEMRQRDRQPFEDRADGLDDVFDVAAESVHFLSGYFSRRLKSK